MKMKLFYFAILIITSLIGINEIIAQDVVISGKLINSEGYPVSQAHLQLKQIGFETYTNSRGEFTITGETGVEIPYDKGTKISFDGQRLSLNCQGENVTVGIFDLSGKEIASVISNQILTGNFALYPGAYVEHPAQSAHIVRAFVGKERSSFLFVKERNSSVNKGLLEDKGVLSEKKSSSSFYSTVDTLVIRHALYVEKRIPLECKICNTGNITVFELVPNAPTNLTGISESYSTVSLNWTDNSNNESGFRIERANMQIVGGWSDFDELVEVSANVTGYTDEGLIQGSHYKYRVLAYNNGGSSPYSEEISVSTQVENPISISGPSTSTGKFDVVVTYSWPGVLVSTSDRFELEESTSPTSGFTKIANSPWGQRPQSYTFSLDKPSGTYYYRARAKKLDVYTEYTDVISVSVNTPVQKAYLKVVNNTRYPMIDVRLNNQQEVGQGLGILQGDSYTFEFSSSGQVNFVLGVGFWDGSYRNVWFLNSGYTQVTTGTTTTITFNNPTIGQLLSNFSSYRDWTGEYWVNLQMNMATFRFYSNGTWKLFDNGTQIGSGTVTLTSWPDNASIVKFKLCNSCDEILLAYPFGQFTYRNGPSSWPLIKYTAQ